MELWFLLIVSISLSALLKPLLNVLFPSFYKPSQNLPPGPFSLPIIGNPFFLRMSSPSDFLPLLHSLHAKYGPIITLRIGSSRPSIFVADRHLAHQALIQNGAVFASRASPSATSRITSCNQHTINSASYGPTWRLLRRNMTSEILHPSRMESFRPGRDWVWGGLKNRLESAAKAGDPVRVLDHFHYAMFCLLSFMCFGEKFDEEKVQRIIEIQRRVFLHMGKFRVLDFSERLTKVFLHKKWAEFFQLRQDRADVFLPLIRSRKKTIEEKLRNSTGREAQDSVISYVDTLFDLQLSNEKRKLNEEEILALCYEFIGAGTDSTSTSLQWIMANLVKYPQIQDKLLMEIRGVIGEETENDVKEEDLQKMPYLKATVLEGLRRHPPGHILVPHAVNEDVVLLNKFLIPKNGTINFVVAEMGLDPNMWEDPMEFKPERFLKDAGAVFDLKCSREIKMMPFGAGRRVCPANDFAIAHLQYWVANLVWSFEWKAVDGRDGVDLSEKHHISCSMKNPLQAYILPRFQK